MYINTATNTYPYTDAQLKRDNPQVSFPASISDEMLASYGVFPVTPTEALYDAAIQVAAQEGCAYNTDNQRWETSWTVRNKTVEELQADAQALQSSIVQSTQARLDDFARTRNYDGILSACTYATSSIPKFAAEGQAAVNARDQTWAALYALMAEVQAGALPMPAGFADVEVLLPELVWPE